MKHLSAALTCCLCWFAACQDLHLGHCKQTDGVSSSPLTLLLFHMPGVWQAWLHGYACDHWDYDKHDYMATPMTVESMTSMTTWICLWPLQAQMFFSSMLPVTHWFYGWSTSCKPDAGKRYPVFRTMELLKGCWEETGATWQSGVRSGPKNSLCLIIVISNWEPLTSKGFD